LDLDSSKHLITLVYEQKGGVANVVRTVRNNEAHKEGMRKGKEV